MNFKKTSASLLCLAIFSIIGIEAYDIDGLSDREQIRQRPSNQTPSVLIEKARLHRQAIYVKCQELENELSKANPDPDKIESLYSDIIQLGYRKFESRRN